MSLFIFQAKRILRNLLVTVAALFLSIGFALPLFHAAAFEPIFYCSAPNFECPDGYFCFHGELFDICEKIPENPVGNPPDGGGDQDGEVNPGQDSSIPGEPLGLIESTRTTGRSAGFGTEKTIPEVIGTVMQWVFGLLGTLTLALFVSGGLQYFASAGNAERVTAARNRMLFAVAGLVIIAAAWVATAYVVGLFLAAR